MCDICILLLPCHYDRPTEISGFQYHNLDEFLLLITVYQLSGNDKLFSLDADHQKTELSHFCQGDHNSNNLQKDSTEAAAVRRETISRRKWNVIEHEFENPSLKIALVQP